MILFRLVRLNEVEVFQELRLKSLKIHSRSMGDLYSEERSKTLVHFMCMLRDNFVIGLYYNDILCGYVIASRYSGGTKKKIAHRAICWGAFIDKYKLISQPNFVSSNVTNLGQQLMNAMMEHLKRSGIKIVTAGIAAENTLSIRMCLAVGFEITHTEKQAMYDPDTNSYNDIVMLIKYL